MVETIDSALRDNNTLGDPGSGDYKVKKGPLRTVLKRIEASAGIGAVTVATKAELDAITDKADNAPGFVVGDSTASNNGQYTWDDSGSAWVKVRDLPDTLTVLENIGGTANAITADTATGVDPAAVQAIVLTAPPGTNTGAVTITLNGGSAESIKAASGTDPAPGDIVEDVATIFFKVGSEWRQIFTSNPNATFDHQGDYDNGTTYTLDQVVTGSDDNWYQLKVASATGDDPVSGGSGDWLKILDGIAVPDDSITSAKMTAATLAKNEGFADYATMIASGLDYTVLSEGDIIFYGDERWPAKVAPSGATNHHFQITGGVKLYAVITPFGWDLRQFGIVLDGATDQRAAVNAVIQNTDITPATFILPAGELYVTGSLYAARGNFSLVGLGPQASKIKFVNASGGTVITGDSDEENSLTTYRYCRFVNFAVVSTAASTDPDICFDMTSFAYSEFDIYMQSKRTNAVLYYGQGNNGSSPYYNRIKSPGLFGGDGAGGTNYTQTAIKFAQGAWGGGSNGPNANFIGPINRAAALEYLCDIDVGNGNQFTHINGESITGAYFRFANNSSIDSGTSTGSNTQVTLKDTGQSWTTNEYINDALVITGGTGAGQARVISSNNATSITLDEPWAVIPDATSTYEIYAGKVYDNKISHIRTEGLASANPDFIHAYPGTRDTSFNNCAVGSLGSGLVIRDESGNPSNKWFSESKAVFTEKIENPGPSANINVYVKSSVLGGANIYQSYVLEWLAVATDRTAIGDTVTTTLDAGGVSVGGGDVTLQTVHPDGSSVSFDIAGPTDRVPKNPASRRIFLNVQTGASFNASADVQITWCATLV